MSTLIGYLGAAGAVVRRDVKIFLTYRLRWVSRLAGTLLTLITFYYVSKLARTGAVGAHASYFAFLIVGIVAIPVLNAGLGVAQFVRQELIAGNFERTLVSPAGPLVAVLAALVFPIGFSTALAAVTLAVGVVLFNVHVTTAGIPLALCVTALGSAGFAAIGVLFVAVMIAFKSSGGVTWVMAGLSLVGGVYFPIHLFPTWIRWAANVQPLSPTIDLLRHLLVNTPLVHPAWVELLKLGGFAALLLPLATFVLSRALSYSRSRGTIMEY